MTSRHTVTIMLYVDQNTSLLEPNKLVRAHPYVYMDSDSLNAGVAM